MGMLRNLSFWRKPSKTAVEPFHTSDDLQQSTAPILQAPLKQPISPLRDVAQVTAARWPYEDVKDLTEDSQETRPDPPTVPRPQASAVAPPVSRLPQARTPAASSHEGRNVTFAPLPSDLDRKEGSTTFFDAEAERLFEAISEAFGSMIATSLQSTKWDKRSQALKAVSSVIKGLDLQGMAAPGSTGMLGRELKAVADRARCWRISCQVLARYLDDKVMPVRLACLELYADTFANVDGLVSQEEVELALGVLFERIVERLGDSNLRLHESARKCVLLTAEQRGLLGLGSVLSRLRARLESCKSKGGERAKVHFGILDAVQVLLQHFPGCRCDGLGDEDDEADMTFSSVDSWTQHDIAPFVVAGLADDTLGPRVRNSAVQLAVTVYQTFGMEAVMPLFAGLRPAKQALLKQKFQESEEDGGIINDDEDGGDDDEGQELRNVDLSGLVVQGCGVRRPSWFQQQVQMQMIPELPGTIGEEEVMMDCILEEAGAVFSGAGITQEEPVSPQDQRPCLEDEFEEFFDGEYPADSRLRDAAARELVHADEDVNRVLEQELLNLGIDVDKIEEQRALISMFEEERDYGQFRSEDPSVEALLSSLVQNHPGDVSVEVF